MKVTLVRVNSTDKKVVVNDVENFFQDGDCFCLNLKNEVVRLYPMIHYKYCEFSND